MLRMKESVPNMSTPDNSFEKAVEALVRKGLELVEKLPSRKIEDVEENSLQAKEKLPYHNVEHTKNVIRRFEEIIEAINSTEEGLVSKRDIMLGKIAAAFHDVVQNFEILSKEDGNFTKTFRKRDFRNNERLSAEMAVKYMKKLGNGVFTDEDVEKVRRLIMMTVPSFNFETGYVLQPNLNNEAEYKNVSYIERALALADLGTSAMEGGDKFNIEGDALFLEDNPDVLDAIYKIKKGEGTDNASANYYAERMKKWLEGQIKFVEGRILATEVELEFFPEKARSTLKEKVFNKFDDTLDKAKKLLEKRKNMNFAELVGDMDYEMKK